MKRKWLLALLLTAAMLLSMAPGVLAAEESSENIVVLYTNDVHCGVDAGSPEESMGYANLAALKKELEAENAYVTLVDAGDAIQGEAIGALSDGGYLVDIMNFIGYDLATFGNHEFDYGMDTALSLLTQADARYIACNFMDLTAGERVTEGYAIVTYGELDVAYVGISTPESVTKSAPTHFQDAEGNYIYGFCAGNDGQDLYDAVQAAIDEAEAAGADVVIAVGHLGVDPASSPWTSYDVIANTTGLDAFIDGHSHSVIEGETVLDQAGREVLLTSTGTKLANIGKMTITPDGRITTELVSGYTQVDAETDAFVKGIQAQFEEKLSQTVGTSEVELVINDPVTGERIIRSQETNLGDFCADAYRTVMDADIAMINGGGIRQTLTAGKVTYGDLIAIHPYGNMLCVVEATGQEILDALELGAMAAPGESGGFFQVSGMKYTVDISVESSVTLDEYGAPISIGETRRVTDVQILQEDGSYAPIDPEATYTLASHNYMLKQGGDGVNFFMDNTIVQDETVIDNEALITYIQDHLGGVIGQEYADPYGQGRITVTDGVSDAEQTPETGDPARTAPVILLIAILAALPLTLRRRRFVR